MLFPGLELLSIAVGVSRGPLIHDEVFLLDDAVVLALPNAQDEMVFAFSPCSFRLMTFTFSSRVNILRLVAIMKAQNLVEKRKLEQCNNATQSKLTTK